MTMTWKVEKLSSTAKAISASRRNDIPAFYGEWFAHRLAAGFVEYIPSGPPRRCRCSLRPEDAVRASFFPRWDRARRWRVAFVHDLDGAMGRCCPESRTIKLTHLPEGEAGVALLIHEIGHAATHQGHGKKWLARMKKAASIAEATGRHELAGHLQEMVDQYCAPTSTVTAADVYWGIEGVVRDYEQAQFTQVVDCVRRDYGLSRRDFLRRYRRARQVFDRAKKEVAESRRAKRWATE
jgi:hypothetical protein